MANWVKEEIKGLNKEECLELLSDNFSKTLSYLVLIWAKATPWIMWLINLTPSSKVAMEMAF